MKFRVEIGEEATEYSFDENTVFVGASEDCHVTLAYEGIGRAHLEISHENGNYYFSDLGSGEKTYLNSDEVTPLTQVEFNSFFPIELGGILIYLVDESIEKEENLDESLSRLSENITQNFNTKGLEVVDTVGGEYDPLVALENELAESEEETEIDQNIAKEEIKENKKKYKPEIYIPTGNTNSGAGSNSLKIRLPVDKSYSTTKKLKVKNSKSKLSNGKKNKKKKKNNAVGSYLILMVVLASTVSIYLLKYKKPLDKNIASKSAKDTYKLKLDSNERIKNLNKIHSEVVNGKKCGNEFEKRICIDHFKNIKLAPYEGAVVVNKTLYISLTKNNLELLTKDKIGYSSGDELWVRRTIENDYEPYFTYDEFKANNNKATLSEFSFNQDSYNLNSLSLFLLLEKKLSKELISNNKVEMIHFFIVDEFKKQVKVSSFLEIRNMMLRLISKTALEDQLQIKGFQNSFLTEGIGDFFKTRTSTHIDDFDTVVFDEYIKTNELQKFLKFVNQSTCDTSSVSDLCEEMRKQRQIKTHEGAFLVKDNLYIKIDIEENKKIFFKKYNKYEYSVKERKQLISNFKKFQLLSDMKVFFKNDFHNDKIKPEESYTNMLTSSFMASNLLALIKNKPEIKKLILLGVDPSNKKSRLKAIISFETKKLAKADIGLNKINHLFFWRSNIPSFNTFLKKKSELSVGFE